MSSENTQLILIILVAILILGILAYLFFRPKAAAAEKAPSAQANAATLPLQLQAYERLIILAERIGLRHLIGRFPTEGLSARDYQAVLVDAIKKEYEYNVSQQIYVAPKVFEAVQNLKEQNIFVINQLCSYIPAESTAKDLAKAIAEYLAGNEHASLQQIVMDALNFEAKKLMH
jgi:hypothetical protein